MHVPIPIVYPHRVSFFSNEGCDVCDSSDSNFIGVHKYIGFRCCGSNNCNNKMQEWIDLTTKSKYELENKYGTNIKVQRSDESIEDNWFIISNAYQEHENGPFWVEVSDENNNSKFVTLSELDELNK